MKNVRATSPHIKNLVAYDPKYLSARIYLNANESPYDPPAAVIEELCAAMRTQMFNRYPDPLAKDLRERIAELHGLSPNNVLLGNGGDELILDIILAFGGSSRKLLTAPPSFSSYELDAALTNTEIVEYVRLDALIDEPGIVQRLSLGDIDMVMLGSPNNPTGDALSKQSIENLLGASDALVLIDQAYIDFADPSYDVIDLLGEHQNLVILRTFSKAYGLAAVRLGYLLASETVIHELCKVRQPYSVDAFSALAGLAVLKHQQVINEQVRYTIAERERVFTALNAMEGVKPYPSEANFILFEVSKAHEVWAHLYERHAILLRDFSSAPHLDDCLRVSIGTKAENDEFLSALMAYL